MGYKSLESFIKRKKVFSFEDIKHWISSRSVLKNYIEKGTILSIGSGIYAYPALDPFMAAVFAVSRFYPEAVISSVTALVIYGLSDERIDLIDIDIPRECSIRNKFLNPHRKSKEKIIGVSKIKYEGMTIKIYSQERALCDAYTLDPDGPLFFKALKRYIKKGNIDSLEISKFDNILKTQVLRSLVQELSDE